MEATTEVVRTDADMEAFEQEIEAAPDAPVGEQDDSTDIEQEPADDADDSGEEAVQPSAEGPSDLLRTMARQVGMRESLIGLARDDKQLQAMIDAEMDARDAAPPERQESEPEQEPEEDFFKLDLGEDEFDDSDPVHRTLKAQVAKLNEYDKRIREREAKLEKNQELLARWANEQIKQQTAVEAKRLYEPFDRVLDGYGTDLFGDKAKGLSKSQVAIRKELSEKYLAIGAMPDLPDDHKEHLADLAVRAYRRDLAEERDKKQQAVKKHAKQRTGGTGRIDPKPKAQTRDEALDEFEDYLMGRVELD